MLNMKRYFLLFLLFISFSGYAQNTINNYKYVLVPEKFSFLKQTDQYKLNTLTKRLLEDKGFTVYFDNSEIPNEIAGNKCNALNVDVTEKNSMLSTKLTLTLKDCRGNIIFKSKEGKSREKEYDISYNLALRDAFTSLDEVHYAYTPGAGSTDQQPAAAVTTSVAASTTAATTASVTTAVAVSQPAVKAAIPEATQVAGTLYAQPTANGYQLIDTTPKKVLTLFKTSSEDHFIADNGSANGIVFKRNDNWFFEYYKNGKLTAEKLLIKF